MRRFAMLAAGLVLAGIVTSAGLYWSELWLAVTQKRCVVMRDGGVVIIYHRQRFGGEAGRLHGDYTVFRRTTSLRALHGRYEDGRQVGTWVFWNEQGRVRRRLHYDEQGQAAFLPSYDPLPALDQHPPPIDQLLPGCRSLWSRAPTPEAGLRSCYWFLKERTLGRDYEELRTALLDQGAVRELEEEGRTARLVVRLDVDEWGWESNVPWTFALEFQGYPNIVSMQVRLRTTPNRDRAIVIDRRLHPPSALLSTALEHRRILECSEKLPIVRHVGLHYGDAPHTVGRRAVAIWPPWTCATTPGCTAVRA